MKRFWKAYAVCVFLLGLLAVLCMGCPFGMVLLVLFRDHPSHTWMLAVLLPAILCLAWAAKSKMGAAGRFEEAKWKFGRIKI